MLEFGNNDSNGDYLKKCLASALPVHPARFPKNLPEFFIKMCTDPGDVVLDPFAGSNITGAVAEKLNRGWIAIEMVEEYLEGSQFRFEDEPPLFSRPKEVQRTERAAAANIGKA